MTRQDPQRTSGTADYPPPGLPCVCGDAEAVHAVVRGQRHGCSTTTARRECRCPRYEPDELAEVAS